jgi:hypothetical protein
MVGPKNPQNPQNFPNTQPSSVSPLGSVRVGSAGGLPAEVRCSARGSGLLSENRTHEHHPSCEWPWQYMWHIIYIWRGILKPLVTWGTPIPGFPHFMKFAHDLKMGRTYQEHVGKSGCKIHQNTQIIPKAYYDILRERWSYMNGIACSNSLFWSKSPPNGMTWWIFQSDSKWHPAAGAAGAWMTFRPRSGCNLYPLGLDRHAESVIYDRVLRMSAYVKTTERLQPVGLLVSECEQVCHDRLLWNVELHMTHQHMTHPPGSPSVTMAWWNAHLQCRTIQLVKIHWGVLNDDGLKRRFRDIQDWWSSGGYSLR